MTNKIVVLTTCSTVEEAEKIARHLVESRVAACVSLSSPVRSIYRWKGAVEDASEIALTIKSRRDLWPQLEAALRKVHPYDVPEMLALPVVEGLPAYLDWLDQELAG